MEKPIALYHRVMRRENFEKAAKDLFHLLKAAQKKSPGCPRLLYVDIDGHRNEEGGYDRDMLELQKDFGIGFLGPFFTEVHFPLISVKNPNPQRNDVPDRLDIFNAENKKDSSLDELYIENYSNTEFMSEEDVYAYLKKVSAFLKEYNEFNLESLPGENAGDDWWIRAWTRHINGLINELFTVFLYGNLLSAAAMTRSLIECYVYFGIILKEQDVPLADEWYICSTCMMAKGEDGEIKEIVKSYCEMKHIDFEEKWGHYKDNKNANAWLHLVIPDKRISFSKVCDHLGDGQIYRDFQSASAFVHGQDVISKISPFTLYSSVYYRFHMMMSYIFRTIRLFQINESLQMQVEELEDGLLTLAERYSV